MEERKTFNKHVSECSSEVNVYFWDWQAHVWKAERVQE